MLLPLRAVIEQAVNDQHAAGGVMGLFRRVLGTLPAANLNQAATLLAEAHQTLTNGAEGSRTQELVVAALGEAGQTVAAVTDMLRRMRRVLDS
jgi:hypothetical protein